MTSWHSIFLILTVLITFASVVSSSAVNDDLQAVFSMGGIKGMVTFSRPQVDGPTRIMVQLSGVSETLTWSIHELPMIYDGNAALSCAANAVGDLFDPTMAKESPNYNSLCQNGNNSRFTACAIGDLGRMLGDISPNTAQMNHTDPQLTIPTSGPQSIMGRTLVLYSGSTPKACALIAPVRAMKTAVAVFKAPVAGFVYLRQVDESSDTSVFVDLFFVNDAQSQSEFTWRINQGVVDTDASDPSTYCKELGELFNPKDSKSANCSQTMHSYCPIGDLTSKHGNITVSLASPKQSTSKMAFTDTNLPLSGANSVIGESIVLFSVSSPDVPVACTKIVTLNPKTVKASFSADENEGVSGYFKFAQASPFDPTKTDINLSGLNNKAEGYHVHAYPSPEYKHLSGSASCEGIIAGDHWNPFNINIKTSPPAGNGTDDEYEIGDLSGKYGSFLNQTSYNAQHTDYNLPLFGRNSIDGRSVVIHNLKIRDKNRRWVCSNLKLDPAPSYAMKTSANFTGPTLSGMILLDQYFSGEDNVAEIESTIFIEITYTDSQTTPTENHKWDISQNPVGNDASAEVSKRCLSLQESFNPLRVYLKGNYSSSCSPTNMIRCEIGDLTNKHAAFEVGGGRQLYSDVNLPLFGGNSGNFFDVGFKPQEGVILFPSLRFCVVVGRGISVSAKDGGKDRLGCANLVADSALFVEKSLEFVKKGSFSSADFAKALSKALGIPKWRFFNIRTQEAEVDKCQIVKFGIIGTANQVSQPVQKLKEIINDNPDALGQYGPSEECEPEPTSRGTRDKHMNIFTLVMVAMTANVLERLCSF